MDLPKFLLCYNSVEPNKAFVFHTNYPKFILEIPSEEIELVDEIPEENETSPEIINEMTTLVREALEFFDQENRLID